MSSSSPLEVLLASRSSALALWQTRFVLSCLQDITGNDVVWKILPVASLADLHPDWSMEDLQNSSDGAKGAFVNALDIALQQKQAHAAVHSLKDLPVTESSLHIAAYLPRHSAWDVCLIPRSKTQFSRVSPYLCAKHMKNLSGYVFATSSLRRRAILQEVGIKTREIRGNIDTRLQKVLRGHPYDALILSGSGIVRLGSSSLEFRKLLRQFWIYPLDPEWCVPAPGQGAIAVHSQRTSEFMPYFERISCGYTEFCTRLERAVVCALGGSCMLPFGCYARVEVSQHKGDWIISITWSVFLASMDGDVVREHFFDSVSYRNPRSQSEVTRRLCAYIPNLVSLTLRQLQRLHVDRIFHKLSLCVPWARDRSR